MAKRTHEIAKEILDRNDCERIITKRNPTKRAKETMNPNHHGGARKGSGRKKGSFKGRTTQTRSISFPIKLWQKIDIKRGISTPSIWLNEAATYLLKKRN